VTDFTIVTAEQRSKEWFAARAGRLTGSKAADAIDFLKTGAKGESAKRRDYKFQLIAECLSGQPEEDGDGYVSQAMQRGIDKEPDLLGAYEIVTGRVARKSGFLAHNTIRAGCSLDAHVGNFIGIVEGKCPKTATHLKYLRENVVPSQYVPQITHNLWISGAVWCDFVSFDDRLPENMRTFIIRVERDEKVIAAYAEQALKFLAEVELEVASLKGWNVLQGTAA
jgi:hypothetical protein